MTDLALLMEVTATNGPNGGGITFDMALTFGNILTFVGMVGMVALYIIDTRYSASGARADLRKVAQSVDKLSTELKVHAQEDTERFETVRRETGEIVAAIRSKLTEVEIYTRDTFVRRDSFQSAMAQQQTMLTTMITDLRQWMGRIERRINRDYAGPDESA